jgi:hypothetical protein
LVGLGLDLDFQLGFAQATRENDFLGNHSGSRQGHGHLLGTRAAFFDHAANRFGYFFEFLDVTIGNPAAFQWFYGTAVQHQIAGLVTAQFDQLDAGGTDIYAQQRRFLSIE